MPLPPWFAWGNVLFYVPTAFVLALGCAWAGAAVALGRFRKARHLPWVERARRAHPARIVRLLDALVLMAVFAVAGWQFGGPVARVGPTAMCLLGGLAAYAAAQCVGLRSERRIQGRRIPGRLWLRSLLVFWLVLMPVLPVLGCLIALAPGTWDLRVVGLLALGAGALAFAALGGGLVVGRVLGLARPASPRLLRAVETAAAGVGVRPRATYELPVYYANAFAVPLGRRLAFTTPALDVLDDGELAAVCAHELGHLAEPRRVIFTRVAFVLALLPLVAVRPTIGSFGAEGLVVGYVVYLAALVVVLMLARRLARRMEERADALGRAHEGDAGTYGRALARLYEYNLAPAVTAGRRPVHPHLYDRLVASGVEPGYPRPSRPSRGRVVLGVGVALVLAFAGLAGLVVARYPVLFVNANPERLLRWGVAVGGGSAAELSQLGYHQFLRGDRDGACALYRAAAEADGESAAHAANLAIVLAGLGRPAEAEAALRDAEERWERGGRSAADRQTLARARAAVGWSRGTATAADDEPGEEP